jgi:outer membrane protein assembly factor BamB
LVVSFQGKAVALNPATGKEIWKCDTVDDYVCPAVMAHEGIVYVTGGRKPMTTVAIRAGGQGDVTQSRVLWRATKTPKVATPLYHDGHLYFFDQQGKAVCLKADSGEVVYEERLNFKGGGDKVYASLVLGDGKLYGVSRQDGAVVLAVGPEFKELARNSLDDKSVFNATPVIVPGRLLIRSDRFLYCIGK